MAARYEAWKEHLNTLDSANLSDRLLVPLMRRGEQEPEKQDALLECNFDANLLALFAEVQYWEKFQGEFTIPYVAHDLCNQRNKLRVMCEHVMLVVARYNDIIMALLPDERRQIGRAHV